MNKPIISVVIPVYNASMYLREALDSLLNQTFGDFEAIAVNDGSTDNSLEILQEYAAKDSRIRVLDGSNGGYGKAMNRGVDVAQGKYVAILEPDDYLPREAYAELVRRAEEYQLDVVKGSFCFFYGTEAGERVYSYLLSHCRAEEVVMPRVCGAEYFDFGPFIWSGLYRLDFLRKYGIRFHETPGASYQDTGFFFLTTAYAERYMSTNEPVYMYRKDNPQSSTQKVNSKVYVLPEEYDYIDAVLSRTEAVRSAVRSVYLDKRVDAMLWVAERLHGSQLQDFSLSISKRLKSEEWDRVSASKRERWKYFEAQPEAYVSSLSLPKTHVQTKTWFGGLLVVEMRESLTTWSMGGIPILIRKLEQLKQRYASGISAESDLTHRYYLLGLPVGRRRINMCNEWLSFNHVRAYVGADKS